MLQRCTEILEQHYELYEGSVDTAAVCLSSAVSILQLVVASSSGKEVATKLMRIHLGTAVERRMRALLHPNVKVMAQEIQVRVHWLNPKYVKVQLYYSTARYWYPV